MAFDKTPPKNNVVLIVAITVGVLLVSLKFVFDSYYHYIFEAEAMAHQTMSKEGEQLKGIRAEEALRAQAIAEAMNTLAKGRESSALIAPKQSDDIQALEGWVKTKKEVAVTSAPVVVPVATDAGIAPVPAASSSAHVMPVASGSAHPAPATSGAHH